MTADEFIAAKDNLEGLKKKLACILPSSKKFKNAKLKYIEALIATKGHAWCMDVKSERKKMARLMADIP